MIEEASGIADSKKNKGYLWVQEDSGSDVAIILLKHDGTVFKKVFLNDVTNRDWEDLCLAGNDLYLADIGDNLKVRSGYTIYKFAEPSATTDTVKNIEHIRFKYSDGAHDAEALLVDPETKDIFILTKRDDPSKIYKIAYPYSTSTVNEATLVGSLPYTGVVSAALSPNGKEIIVKLYTSLFYYKRGQGETIDKVLQKKYKTLPYTFEPQGEAVGFAAAGNGFFTLSEKGLGSKVYLYFYKRK